MKQYSGWQALYLAFYSPSFYQEVGKYWGGIGWLYLFSLTCLFSLVIACQFQFIAVPKMQQWFEKAIEPMPKITIENGHLSIDKPSPYTVTIDSGTFDSSKAGTRSRDIQPVTIIFDTREKPVDISQMKGAILVTSDKLRICSSNRSVKKDESVDFHSVDHVQLDKNNVKLAVNFYLKCLGIIVFLSSLIVMFILCAFQTLLYGGLVKLTAGEQLSYGTIVKLSSVTLTPVILADLLFKSMSINVPFWWLLSIIIALGYLYFAVDVNKATA